MATSETTIHINPHFFAEREKTLVEVGPLSASTFLFDSGVCGLRLKNELGQLVTLQMGALTTFATAPTNWTQASAGSRAPGIKMRWA